MFSKYDLHEAMKIEPGQYPVEGFTPQEMRVGIARASYYSTITRNVSAIAEREGWSGEDKFTALAFYLLLRLETVENLMLLRANMDPKVPWVQSSSEGKCA